MRYLSPSMYSKVLLRGLAELGLTTEQAERLIDARFPMCCQGLVSECFGRGLQVDLADVHDVLREEIGDPSFDVNLALLDAPHAEFIISRLVESDRAKLTPAGELFQHDDAWMKRRFDPTPAETN